MTSNPNNFQKEVLNRLSACLVVTDREEEFNRLSENQPFISEDTEFCYYKAIFLIKKGQNEEALNILRKIVKTQPDFKNANNLASQLYLHQISFAIKETNYSKLTFLLNEAFQLITDQNEIINVLSKYKNIYPIACIKAGTRKKAAKYWKGAINKEPHNHWTVFYLALLYYWSAIKAEKIGGKDSLTTALWKKAIGYWVRLVNSPQFWQEWKDFRARYTGVEIKDKDLDQLK